MDVVKLALKPDGTLDLEVGWLLWALLGLLVLTVLIVRWRAGGSLLSKRYEIDSTEIGVGSSKLIFRPNLNDKAVAYKIWVELSTRKIGLPIDFDHDVIAEIYDSWYSFFAVTRDLIKDIPVQKVRNTSTRKIILLSIDVLNEGLRPHLTKWQARFRRWYDYKLSTDPEAKFHPQDIQKEFPGFDELVEDMRLVNQRLMRYREKMNGLVYA